MAANRIYEIMFIIDSDAPDDEVAQLSEGFQRIITDQGGTITKAETMGKRKLAYPIGRKNEGTYILLEIEGSGREIAELERRMRVNDRIIRYITVRVDEDRRRAEKFQAKRARKAAKRPSAQKSAPAVAVARPAVAAVPAGGFDEVTTIPPIGD